jgi:outer membrane protein OmpA-like peptidoglycan-associated protein
MKNNNIISLGLIITLCFLAAPLRTAAEDLSGAPAAFVDIGYGARPKGMGGAYVGLADDSYGLLWNPAGLATMQRNEASLMWTNQFTFPYYVATYAQEMPKHEDQHLGGAAIYSGDDLGISSELQLVGAYAMSLLPFIPEFVPMLDFSAGSSVKLKYMSFGGGTGRYSALNSDGSAFGLGLNLGVKCDITRQAAVGLVFKDVLDFTKYNNSLKGAESGTEFNPTYMVMGTALRPASFLLVAADWKKTFYQDTHDRVMFGFEFNIVDMVFPRLGYAQDLSSIRNAEYTFGLGLDYRFEPTKGIIFDYAFILDDLPGTNPSRVNLTYYWGAKPKDRDNDGIGDKQDKCPDQPEDKDGFMDEDGCPDLDNDNDSIPDDKDRCPGEAEDKDGYQDEDGCPEPDNDLDGVLDKNDKCPQEAEDKDGFNDQDGCADPDNDQDGVLDKQDKCPGTDETMAQGILTKGGKDRDGCPDLDIDKDGVPNDKDKCPNTPPNEKVDSVGCPVKTIQDADQDGIPDAQDKCPTLKEDFDGFEDLDGCPDLDNDQDGIRDSLDKCPNNKEDMDGFEDTDGCPDLDNDKDGVPDSLDKCPTTPAGEKVDSVGCPVKKVEIIKKGAKMVLRGVNFQTGSAALTDDSYPILSQVFESLEGNPEVEVEIRGYTDNVGSAQTNISLSQKRAESVKQYLVNRGIAPNRVVAKGLGPADPIASNKTSAGKAQNRRIEFVRVK